MRFSAREDVLALTPLNPFDRFDDGRPRVPDDLLDRLKSISLEQAWGLLKNKGYLYQFEGDWLNLHPERVMVGRCITCAFTPIRPDLNDVVNEQGHAEGRHGSQNNWVIHTVGARDVVVADLFGKIKDGTFVGDNLSNAVWGRGGAGLVINGGIRDIAGIFELPDMNVYCRGTDPSAIKDMTLTQLNGPVRLGQATVLPGDVALGSRGGVIFIPPHLVEEVVTHGEEVSLKDEFGHQRLREGKYSSGQIDTAWTEDIVADYEEWKRRRGTV